MFVTEAWSREATLTIKYAASIATPARTAIASPVLTEFPERMGLA